MLSDHDILREYDQKRLIIDPKPDFERDLQPASLDVYLGCDLKYQSKGYYPYAGLVESEFAAIDLCNFPKERPFRLYQGDFALGTTNFHIELPDDLASKFEGCSSIGRKGLFIHVTAGFIDPGFKGELTVELANASPQPVTLYTGMRIGQLCFFRLDSPSDRPYDGHYVNQKGATKAWDA